MGRAIVHETRTGLLASAFCFFFFFQWQIGPTLRRPIALRRLRPVAANLLISVHHSCSEAAIGSGESNASDKPISFESAPDKWSAINAPKAEIICSL
ncbi:hypothetical protein NDU88_001979 [Pleurodeles waltl]|uniref:Secreted protein n=1 Tax=Pleurodeles waltl TaxID=8319 RepID=A0AAV7UUV0_PLEWA|nr:hypothetical protein NDU88_001979 [Pleurodeles waltl]